MNPHRAKAYFYLTLVSLIWGIATPVIKFTLQGIEPLPFLTYRFFLSAVFSVLWIIIFKSSLRLIKKNIGQVIIYGFITTTLALGILFLGISRTTVIETALIVAVSPLLTALAGVWFLKEKVTKQERLGISIAFLGTLVVILAPAINGGIEFGKITGNLLVLTYVVIMAYSAVMSKRLVRKKIEPLTLTNVSFIIGLLTILPIFLYFSGSESLLSTIYHLPSTYTAGVWYMALISGSIAYALWVRAQKTIEISEAGVFAYLIPIFAAPLAIIWLGETLKPSLVVGAILITIGVIIAEYKKRTNK